MIEPSYLASLRHRYRAELVLVMVQLEQVTPGWWSHLGELAEQLGTDRATLNRSLSHLERQDLIARVSFANGGGTYIWWVSRHQGDKPQRQDEPAWVLRDVRRSETVRIRITDRRNWADHHGISPHTLRDFLHGHHRLLRNRWEVVATPLDQMGPGRE